jgi:hypothetical protein
MNLRLALQFGLMIGIARLRQMSNDKSRDLEGLAGP